MSDSQVWGQDNGFTLEVLTSAINLLPNRYSRVSDMGLYRFEGLSVPSISVEVRDGVLNLVGSTPWGGQAPKNNEGSAVLKSFSIPHMPLEDVVLASDVMGRRAFGSISELQTVPSRVLDKLQSMKNKIDQTNEYRRFCGLKGKVLDANGTTVLADYYDTFGVQEKVITFKFGDPTFVTRTACLAVLRHMEDNLQGESMSGARVLVSQEFMDELIDADDVRATYLNYAAAQNALGGDPRKGFSYGGLEFEEYRGIVKNRRFIEAGQGHAFPEGTSDTFVEYGAPADFIETVNTIALPYYARQEIKEFNRGVDLHVQSNTLPLVRRPGTLVRVKIG